MLAAFHDLSTAVVRTRVSVPDASRSVYHYFNEIQSVRDDSLSKRGIDELETQDCP